MIYDIIEQLRSTNSRLEKEAILKSNFDNEELKSVFLAAHNPLTQYYIKKIPQYTPADDPTYVAYSLQMAIDQLGYLSSREKTGNAGIEHLTNILESVCPSDAKVIELIIGKDMKCGVDSTINKIWKGLIPETPYMRCSLLKDMKNVDWAKGLISQTKADGSFTYFNHNEDGSVEIFTRNGRHYEVNSNFDSLIAQKVFIPRGWQVHGELLVEENGVILNRQTGNGILNSILKGGTLGIGQTIVYDVWDMIPIDNFVPGGEYQVPYKDRLVKLSESISGAADFRLISSKIVFSLDEAMEDYQAKLELGLEGTILKDPEAPWEDKTSKKMWKVKVEFEVDLEIVDFNEGKGKNAATFGSIKTKTSDELLFVNVSGFTDELRELLNTKRKETTGKIMTVRSNAFIKSRGGSYSLFLPRHVEIREDKTVADTLAQVIEQYESVIYAKKKGK